MAQLIMKTNINNESQKIASATQAGTNKTSFSLAGLNQSGFSLVELMVGLVIGLIAAFVIINVFSNFENQKRTTTGAGDAQTNATIGLYSIQREVQKAGFGLPIFDGSIEDSRNGDQSNNHSALRCVSATPATIPALPIDHDGLPGSPPVDGAVPIAIVDGAAGASDTITVGYSTPTSTIAVAPALPRVTVPLPTLIVTQDTATTNSLEVSNNMGCIPGDIAVVVNGPNCISARVTTSVANLAAFPKRIQLTSTAGITDGSRLTCIGPLYTMIGFGVNANNELVRNGTPIISEIVNMQAQYGITAANNSNEITQWVDAPALTDKNRIRAIRVAIVSRSGQLETNIVTNAAPISWVGGPAVNLAANANWQRYRYRVYEAIIPMRNLSFSGALL